jgi:hypothetical protein
MAVKASLRILDSISAEQASMGVYSVLYGEPIAKPEIDGESEASNG